MIETLIESLVSVIGLAVIGYGLSRLKKRHDRAPRHTSRAVMVTVTILGAACLSLLAVWAL